MNWWEGGGFIQIINYSGIAEAMTEGFAILTENDFDILTELSQELLVESSP